MVTSEQRSCLGLWHGICTSDKRSRGKRVVFNSVVLEFLTHRGARHCKVILRANLIWGLPLRQLEATLQIPCVLGTGI